MTRYREISPAEMTSAQKEVHDEIVAGRRGRFGGPFQILIRAPEYAAICSGSASICGGAVRYLRPCQSSRSA